VNARTRNARTQKTTPNDEFQIREKARVGRSVLPFGAEGGLRQRDVGAERVERVGVQARSLGAARREGPAGGRGEGGFSRGRRPLDGHGVAKDLRQHVGGGLRRRAPGRRSGGRELLREAADGGL